MLRVPCFAHFVATTTYDVRVCGLVWRQRFRYRGDVLFDVLRKSRTNGEKRVISSYWLFSFSTGDRAGCSIHLGDDLLRRRKHRQRNRTRNYDYPKDKLQLVACFLKASTPAKIQRTCIHIHVFINRYVAWVFQDSSWIGANTRSHMET